MGLEFNKKPFYNIVVVSLILLLFTVPVSAELKGNLNDKMDVIVTVQPWAKTGRLEDSTDDINVNEWKSGKLTDSLGRLKTDFATMDDIDNLDPSTKGAFTGKSETRWAREKLTLRVNSDVVLSFEAEDATYQGEDPNYNKTLDIKYNYIYENETSKKFGDGGGIEMLGISKGNHRIDVIAELTIPEEFWTVRTGKYSGKVTVTIGAK